MGKQIIFWTIKEKIQRRLYAIDSIGYPEACFGIPLLSLRLKIELLKGSQPAENVNIWGKKLHHTPYNFYTSRYFYEVILHQHIQHQKTPQEATSATRAKMDLVNQSVPPLYSIPFPAVLLPS